MAHRRAALLQAGYPYLVAERAGDVLGYAYAGPYRSRAAYRSTVEDSIYVAPDAQGQGVGRALLAALLKACEAQDFRLMVAVIGDEASLGSIRLHRSLGFEHVGVLKPIGYKHGRWLATVLMQRVLGPGDGVPPTRPIG
jgi:phosphinothricin acetyltransferase